MDSKTIRPKSWDLCPKLGSFTELSLFHIGGNNADGPLSHTELANSILRTKRKIDEEKSRSTSIHVTDGNKKLKTMAGKEKADPLSLFSNLLPVDPANQEILWSMIMYN